MNVRDFARLTAREIRSDAQFWDDLSESVANGTVDRLRTLPPLQRRAYSVPEVAQMLGVGHTAVRNAIARGDLRVVRVGGRVLVPLTAIATLPGDELNLQFRWQHGS
ncbi:MAG: sigma-70 region 4 domain-containing protein [Dehalococcoidia bacterium]|nr:sigma-70 region 4 domain-containing protein [Dehalococcoidia bacterium]